MLRLFIFILLVIAITISSCSKNNTAQEAMFYGIWVKGTQVGDTLIFKTENDKNVLLYNLSFNPSLNAYNSVGYSYKNNKLQVALFGGSETEISSFAWTQQGKEFELLGYQLFPFMSSTGTKFTYTKIQ